MRKNVLYLLGLIALVAADQFTKFYILKQPSYDGLVLIPGVLKIIKHQNYGIIANVPLPMWLILVATLIVMAFILVNLKRAIAKSSSGRAVALTLLLAGAFGNLIDRLRYDFVFDWILLFGQSAINLADIFIAIGLLWYLLIIKREQRSTKIPACRQAGESYTKYTNNI
ncbi:MAG: signal peptidase II [Patescibacteria group bacterium]|nr:signal peptidase II [Patescibacteria group bacterium]MBU2509282.1 signal peptidase II [Patescibacteria group bacterium]